MKRIFLVLVVICIARPMMVKAQSTTTTNAIETPGPVSIGTTSPLSGTISAGKAEFNGSPWIDPMNPAYGAKCDGTTDDSTALQAAFTAAASVNPPLPVVIPAGVACYTTTTIDAKGASLMGFGGVNSGGSVATGTHGASSRILWGGQRCSNRGYKFCQRGAV